MEVKITSKYTPAEIKNFSIMIAESEPWITLKRDAESVYNSLLNQSVEIFIARIKKEPAGIIAIDMNGALKGYIKIVFVAEKWRGKNIGAKLTAFAEKRIFRETPNVFLLVSSFNRAGLYFYLSLGYEIIGKLKNYVLSGYSEILLRKSAGPIDEFKAS